MGEIDSGSDSASGIIWKGEQFNPLVQRQFLNWYRMVMVLVAWLIVDIVLSVGHDHTPRAYIYVYAGIFAALTGIAISILTLSAKEPKELPPPGMSASGRTAGLIMGSGYFLISAGALLGSVSFLIRAG